MMGLWANGLWRRVSELASDARSPGSARIPTASRRRIMVMDELQKVQKLADELEEGRSARANNVVPLIAAVDASREQVRYKRR